MAGDRLPLSNQHRIESDETADSFTELTDDDVSYSESDSKINEWLDSNRVENYQPFLTVYKFRHETGTEKEQCETYRGEIPSRHEIGLEYGGGRFLVIMGNGAYDKKLRKTTSFQFRLHNSYDAKSREYYAVKMKNSGLGSAPAGSQISADPRQTFAESLALVQSIQNNMLSMFRPLIERALLPAPAAPAPAAVNPLHETMQSAAIFKQLIKSNMEDTVSIMNDLTRKTLELNQREIADYSDDDDELPPEKKSMFDKILELAEPLLPLLIKNTVAAKATAAGIRAIPAFREVVKDTELVRRVISYVDAKESPEKADIALRNLGINRAKFSTAGRSAHVAIRGGAPAGSGAARLRSLPPPKQKGSGVFRPKSPEK